MDINGYINGYIQCWYEGKRTRVHRVIAELCIPNPENKPEVNHINGDKQDNRIVNLEWVTRSENEVHKYKNKMGGKRGNIRKLGNKYWAQIRICQKMYTKGFKSKPDAEQYLLLIRKRNDI